MLDHKREDRECDTIKWDKHKCDMPGRIGIEGSITVHIEVEGTPKI